jgi:hypothetical protein
MPITYLMWLDFVLARSQRLESSDSIFPRLRRPDAHQGLLEPLGTARPFLAIARWHSILQMRPPDLDYISPLIGTLANDSARVDIDRGVVRGGGVWLASLMSSSLRYRQSHQCSFTRGPVARDKLRASESSTVRAVPCSARSCSRCSER